MQSSGRFAHFALPYMRFLFVSPRVCLCRRFAAATSSFLQIPPHGGHPCLRLTVPTAKSVVVFLHQVIAHAGRTQNGRSSPSRENCARFWTQGRSIVDNPERLTLTEYQFRGKEYHLSKLRYMFSLWKSTSIWRHFVSKSLRGLFLQRA